MDDCEPVFWRSFVCCRRCVYSYSVIRAGAVLEGFQIISNEVAIQFNYVGGEAMFESR